MRRDVLAPWRSWCGLLAVVVVALDLVSHGFLLSNGFFGQDDFLVLTDTARRGPGGLWQADHTGGIAPGANLLAWALGSVAPLGWGVAVLPVLILRTASAVVLWPLLTRLVGERWLRLPLLVLFCATPLTLWVTQWWWVGIRFWPATFALLVACWALVARIQGGSRHLTPVVLASLVLALCFSPLALLHPLVLVGLALVVQAGDTLGARARALGDLRRLWAGVALVVAVYVAFRAFAAPLSLGAGPDAGDIVTDYVRHLAAEAWGGPWTGTVIGHAALVPPTWAVAVGGALLLALVGATLQSGPAARAAWLLFALHTLASAALAVVLSDANAFAALGMVPRVAAEAAPVLVLSLAGALSALDLGPVIARLPARLRTLLAPDRAEGLLSGLLVLALLASAVVSTRLLAPTLLHEEARSYVTNVRDGLRDDPRTVVLDSSVPAEIIDPLFGDRARVSEVVGLAPERAVFDVASSRLRVVDEDGELVEPQLTTAASAAPSDDPTCRYPVRADGTSIPLTEALPSDRWVVRIGYFTSAETFVELRAAGREVGFAVTPGLHVVYVQLDGPLDSLAFTLADVGPTLCVTNVDVGVPLGATP